jgi:hypothetical protein
MIFLHNIMSKYIRSISERISFNRESKIYLPVYFFLSLVNLVLKLRLTPTWVDGTLAHNHQLLLAFQYTNNEQSRLLQFLVPEFLRVAFSLSIGTSYALARLLFVFLAFAVFHYFLRKWFNPFESFTGVLILNGSMVVAFLIDDLQESAPLLMLLFILGLWAIREKKDWMFALLLFIGGGLTNETMLVMPVGYFFYRLQSKKLADIFQTGARTVLLALPAFLTQGLLRYITRGNPYLDSGFRLPDNLDRIWHELINPGYTLFHGTFIYPFLIFSIFWVLAILSYSKSPPFLRNVFWIVPFFIAGNLITGIINESRQMIPLGFIIIPMALFFIIPEARTRSSPD